MTDPDFRLHVPRQVEAGKPFTVEVEFDGDAHQRRLWVFGVSGPYWSCHRDTLLVMDQNPISYCREFPMRAGKFPGAYLLFARLLDSRGRIEYVSERAEVEVVRRGAARSVEEGIPGAA